MLTAPDKICKAFALPEDGFYAALTCFLSPGEDIAANDF
jgi:hypothetical protein